MPKRNNSNYKQIDDGAITVHDYDIARRACGSATVAHCFYPALGELSSRVASEPSSIAVAFSTQRNAVVRIDGSAARLRTALAQSFVVTGAEPVEWLKVDEPAECLEVTATPAFRKSVADEFFLSDPANMSYHEGNYDPLLWILATKLRGAARGTLHLSDIERDHIVRLIYGHVFRRCFGGTLRERGDGALSPDRLSRVLEYIDAHCSDELTIARLADIAALSPFHFLRSFRRSTGETPHRFVQARRLEQARNSLRRGDDLSIVARRFGFSKISRFKSAYCAHFGHSVSATPRRAAISGCWVRS